MNTNLDKLKEVYRSILGLSSLYGALIITILILFIPIPKENEQLVTAILGGIWGYVGAIITFDFGGSRGSEKKTDIMLENSNNQKQ